MERITAIISKLSHSLAEMEELAREDHHLNDLTSAQMHYRKSSTISKPQCNGTVPPWLDETYRYVALDRLMQKGYVAKIQSDEDRRSSHLHLTKKGMQINSVHEHAHARFVELMEEALEPAELEQLTILLEKLTRSLN